MKFDSLKRTNFAVAARTNIYPQRCIPRGAMNAPHRIRRIKKFRIQQPQRPCRPPSVFSIIQRLVYGFQAYLPFFQLNEATHPIKSAHISCDPWTIDDSVKKSDIYFSYIFLIFSPDSCNIFLGHFTHINGNYATRTTSFDILQQWNAACRKMKIRYYIFALCRN